MYDHCAAFHSTSDPNDWDQHHDQEFLRLCQEIVDCVSSIQRLNTPRVLTLSKNEEITDLFKRYQVFKPDFKRLCSALPSEIRAFIDTDDRFHWCQKTHLQDVLEPVSFLLNRLSELGSSTDRLKNARRRSRDQYQSLEKYIDELFERYSRLLVIRIDCSYTKETRHMDFELARIHRTCFFETARYPQPDDSEIFNNRVGFCWKLEWGIRKLLHYHFLFFYDGARVREDITLAKRLERRWKWIVATTTPPDIPQVIGSTFNCNQYALNHHRDDPNNALGMIAHHQDKRRALERVIRYLSKFELKKSDDIVSAIVPDGYRTVGYGRVPSRSNRGRPRQNHRIEP